MLTEREATLELDARGACPTFVYANAGETGYYRVRIGPAELAALAPVLGKLPERERFGVVSNAWAAVRAGQLPLSAFLELLGRFKNDPSRLVWTEILDALRSIDRTFVTDAMRPAFARFVRALCGPAARRLGWRAAETQPDDERLHARGDPDRDRRSRRRRAPRWRRRRAARAPGCNRRRATPPTWRASRCRSPPGAATRRCSISCWPWSPTRPRPRRA